MPIRQKPYCCSPAKLQEMKSHLEDMLADGVITSSTSPYAAPVVLVPQKNNPKTWFCVDFRKLNSATQTDAYPIPNIQEILESHSRSSVFTTIDLKSGYRQLVYLDDIIIHSSSLEQQCYDLQAVFDMLREVGLTINMKKCQFFRTSFKFLGHVVSVAEVKVDEEKTQAVQAFPTPRNLKELQRFLGIAGRYHCFVPNFSQIAEPLNGSKRKGSKYIWTSTCQIAFETLKQRLASSPILGHPDFTLPFIVYTDASDVGLGADWIGKWTGHCFH